ncbi:putative endonuclease [Dysgonomonas sp. PH5-45]|uniref:GIY-YIG nuclease family protein n=1 Tax=unclassified Dysgonomonas TaxID=2630389 RepID=UPI002473FD1C|nr:MULTISPECIES: GIY-YIG nuclease family protein [unclassified Dysgonomonas]MDH6354824.1 putative endonuclease [Dysgonomonas sp. PH5-45]MDH6387723.1 putative endonuclease [Dysgonomonas sp. PH5-37]
MKPLGMHNYYVYITTNATKTVLYTGVTNDLSRRLYEHKEDALNGKKYFAGKYNAYNLIYWERFAYIEDAINREKEIKGWTRQKKENLVKEINPQFAFLNDEVL